MIADIMDVDEELERNPVWVSIMVKEEREMRRMLLIIAGLILGAVLVACTAGGEGSGGRVTAGGERAGGRVTAGGEKTVGTEKSAGMEKGGSEGAKGAENAPAGDIYADIVGTWKDRNGGTELIISDDTVTIRYGEFDEEYGYRVEDRDGRMVIRSDSEYGYFGSMTEMTMMDDGTLRSELMEDDGGHGYRFEKVE